MLHVTSEESIPWGILVNAWERLQSVQSDHVGERSNHTHLQFFSVYLRFRMLLVVDGSGNPSILSIIR